jgi:hypothetical protein
MLRARGATERLPSRLPCHLGLLGPYSNLLVARWSSLILDILAVRFAPENLIQAAVDEFVIG